MELQTPSYVQTRFGVYALHWPMFPKRRIVTMPDTQIHISNGVLIRGHLHGREHPSGTVARRRRIAQRRLAQCRSRGERL